jgi:WD40 repeat protein/tetratricopeptide (TPR) repeat protein
MRPADEGDYLGALPWFAEALRLDEGNPSRERLDRIRLGDTLRRSPRLVQAWFHPAEVWSAAFSRDGRLLAIAGQDGVARVWDTGTGREALPPLRHTGGVNMVAFSPDGRRLLTASEDGTAQQWDAVTGARVGPPLRHLGAVYSASYSRDGRRIATASADRTARIWSAVSGAPLTPPLPHGAAAVDADFSPDGLRLATAAGDTPAHQNQGTHAEVRLWDAHSGRLLSVVLPPSPAPARSIVFSPDGRFLAGALAGGGAAVWDGRSGRLVSRPRNYPAWVHSVVFSPDSRRLVTAGSTPNAACVWDPATGEPVAPPLRHAGEVLDAVFSPDGRRIATTSYDRTARVWDATTGDPLTPPLTHGNLVTTAVFTPDGRRLATVGRDGTIKLWDLAGSNRAVSWPAPGPWRRRGWLSPDGRRRIAARPDGSDQVLDAATGKPLTPPMRHGAVVNYAEFSPDGRRLITASQDGTARVWEAASGKPLSSSLQHRMEVIHASFSEDGELVITCKAHEARVWEAVTGDPVTAPLPVVSWLTRGEFIQDGRRALVGAMRGTLTWELSPDRRPAADLALLALLLSGYRIDARGNAVQVEAGTWRHAWETLHARYPEEFVASRAETHAWEFEAWSAELFGLLRGGNVAAVRAHVSRQGPPEPGRTGLYSDLGECYAADGDLKAAAEAYVTLTDGGGSPGQWYRRALLQLAQGDEAGYRATCQRALARLGSTEDPRTANMVAWTCALAPGAVPDLTVPVRLSEKAVASQPKASGWLNTLGLILYRAGRCEEAVQRLNEAIAAGGKGGTVDDWLFLAMAHQRLGHTREARQWLSKAVPQAKQELAASPPPRWFERLELELLRREAEKVVR